MSSTRTRVTTRNAAQQHPLDACCETLWPGVITLALPAPPAGVDVEPMLFYEERYSTEKVRRYRGLLRLTGP
jgi:hypothetical protein